MATQQRSPAWTAPDGRQRRELVLAERRARGEAEEARRRLELLAAAGSVLSGSLHPDETLDAIARTIVPAVADWCRIDLLDEGGLLQRRLAYHSDPERSERALQQAKLVRARPETMGSMAWVLETGCSYFGRFDEPHVLADAALREYTQAFGMRSHFIVPLTARGRTIGVMAVVQAESGRDLSEDDRALVQELGLRAALALDNARLYAEAETARRQAESANRAKDDFLAMLGHELRNPLAPIATALEVMARRNPNDCVEERQVIARQVTHLARLIDDLLDVSRITQGKIELRREPVDLETVMTHAVELTRPLFERQRHQVTLSLSPASVNVMGDPVRLAQVLCNLLVNAGKFTPAGGRVRLALQAHEGFAELSVEDNGRGIEPELLPRVFDLFVQGGQAIDRQAGGLGLGLAIVRTIVTMHGGTVSAESAGRGLGSRFVVRLPLSAEIPAVASDAGAPRPQPAFGGRILVVDDNTDAAETLAELLRICGFEVDCVGDGRAALGTLDGRVPELALLDIGLPGLDGYQLARAFRADPRAAQMKLVALTGYGRDNDRARALASSFDEHLVKPVACERLFEVLGRLMPR